MECGDSSPLSAGDLSPSKPGGELSPGNSPLARAGSLSALEPASAFDGDESPAESGDKSPHSTARTVHSNSPWRRVDFGG